MIFIRVKKLVQAARGSLHRRGFILHLQINIMDLSIRLFCGGPEIPIDQRRIRLIERIILYRDIGRKGDCAAPPIPYMAAYRH